MHSDDFQSFLKTVLPPMGYQWRRFDRRNIRRKMRLRMESLNIHEAEKYARLVISDSTERQTLESMLRLTITRFFRNAWLWPELGSLATQISGDLIAGETLRVWSAGCAGGEEAFSAAMLFNDLNRTGQLPSPWHILATDTDSASLGRAVSTDYQWGSVREVPGHLLERWFKLDGGLWVLDQELRDMVAFEEHDIVAEAPPGRFQIVFLRNCVLTYNVEKVQRDVLDGIRQSLLDPGYLVIGRTEKVPDGTGFEKVSKCIYQKI